MQIYGPNYLHGPQAIGGPHGPQPPQAQPNQATGPIQDELQISDAAQLLDKVNDVPEMRTQRIEQIRAQIANGTYETQEKLDIAVERLLDEIG